MDNTQIKTTMIGSFSSVNNVDDSLTLWDNILVKIFEKDSSGSKIAVAVSNTSEVGSYSHYDVYVYDSYTNALDKINELEYKPNTAVNVIEMNVNGYSSIFDKTFDGVCYSRLAHVKFHSWDAFDVRKMWDLKTDDYVVEYIEYV